MYRDVYSPSTTLVQHGHSQNICDTGENITGKEEWRHVRYVFIHDIGFWFLETRSTRKQVLNSCCVGLIVRSHLWTPWCQRDSLRWPLRWWSCRSWFTLSSHTGCFSRSWCFLCFLLSDPRRRILCFFALSGFLCPLSTAILSVCFMNLHMMRKMKYLLCNWGWQFWFQYPCCGWEKASRSQRTWQSRVQFTCRPDGVSVLARGIWLLQPFPSDPGGAFMSDTCSGTQKIHSRRNNAEQSYVLDMLEPSFISRAANWLVGAKASLHRWHK